MQAEKNLATKEAVLALVKAGKSTAQISKELGISRSTVKYHRNPGLQTLINKATTSRRRQLKEKAVDFSGGSCLKCGYGLCHGAMTFHHLDPKEKDMTLSRGRNWKWEVTLKELLKTILLCNRCHTEHHCGLWIPDKAMINRQQALRDAYVDKPLEAY